MDKKIWYVNFPTFQYKENVKELAIKNGLKIIDAQFQGDNEQCENAPKLTLIKADKKVDKEIKADKKAEKLEEVIPLVKEEKEDKE